MPFSVTPSFHSIFRSSRRADSKSKLPITPFESTRP
jgi:hypothetical protein